MAPTGQRTIPAADAPKATGLERSFLLPFLSSNLHPIIPSHLHLREMEEKMKKGGKKKSLTGSLAHLHHGVSSLSVFLALRHMKHLHPPL